MKDCGLNRRSLLLGVASTAALVSSPLWAHDQASSEPAEDNLPTFITLDADLPPGQIHVLPDRFKLYWTLPDRQALRFAIGVARPELYAPGRYEVGAKREWPSWRPTPAMIAREPEKYARHARGMPGGPDNPLGARALYLFDEAGHDTMLRIHGTNDASTIGKAVSNGCARLTNDDIVVLYDSVPVGTRVILHDPSAPTADELFGFS